MRCSGQCVYVNIPMDTCTHYSKVLYQPASPWLGTDSQSIRYPSSFESNHQLLHSPCPSPCDSEFREDSSWPLLKPIAFSSQPCKCLVRRQILYWSATCRVHLWPHMGGIQKISWNKRILGVLLCIYKCVHTCGGYLCVYWYMAVCIHLFLRYMTEYVHMYIYAYICTYHVGMKSIYVCERACMLWEWKLQSMLYGMHTLSVCICNCSMCAWVCGCAGKQGMNMYYVPTSPGGHLQT